MTDPCDRARQALGELCGPGEFPSDSNTFYFRVTHQVRRDTPTPEQTDRVAERAEGTLVTRLTPKLDLDEDRGEVQTIVGGGGDIRTYFKIPRKTMTPVEVQTAMEEIVSNMPDTTVIGKFLRLDQVRLVDRSVAAADIPEMVGPPIEDAEVM